MIYCKIILNCHAPIYYSYNVLVDYSTWAVGLAMISLVVERRESRDVAGAAERERRKTKTTTKTCGRDNEEERQLRRETTTTATTTGAVEDQEHTI